MKKLQIQNILVPIDFSEMSIRAIATAKNLARRFGATVHLANFREDYYPAAFLTPPAPVPILPISYEQDEQKAASQQLKALAEDHELTGTCHAEIGGPAFDEICRVARQIPADLIVASTQGRTGLKHAFLGSTAERLVQYAPCPVLVARETEAKGGAREKVKTGVRTINTILAPVDFSECSRAGLQYAIQFADQFAAHIIVLHVVDFGPTLTADGYAMYDLAKYREMAHADAEWQMCQFVRTVKFGGVKYKAVIVTAPSVMGICAAARKEEADVIITATHGRTGFRHVLIGSIAEAVVRHAPCPVLVVPSHSDVRTAQLTGRKQAVFRRTPSSKARVSRHPLPAATLSRAAGKMKRQPVPEHRTTNKFRESHLSPRLALASR
ncbi:MAG TPA: universal stress protein [Chthoniobacterales bacterium]|jgi:nucleotide-binding universal stress UspA family protein